MGDQLSLELEPLLPAPPDTLRPMQPKPAAAIFDSSDHLFEPWWGGRRVLAFLEPAVREEAPGRFATAVGGPSVRLRDEAGRDLAAAVPELSGLVLRLDGGSAVVDGELVVVDRTGRADHAALRRRLDRPGRRAAGRGEATADEGSRDGVPGHAAPPVAFLAHDLLYLDGRLLLSWPLERRRERLARVVRGGPEVVVVPATAGEGRALHDAVTAQGIAGVLARSRTSPYLPGVRSRLWRLIPAGPASGGPAAAPDPDLPASAPVLALIQRLPLGLDEG